MKSELEHISAMLVREGWPLFTDRPADRGGPTKGGITLPTLSAFLGHPADVETLRDLPRATAIALYSQMFYQPWTWVVDDDLRDLLFDMDVNHGQHMTVHMLQEAISVPVTGVVGPLTQKMVNGTNATALHHRIYRMRQDFYLGLALNEPEVQVFMKKTFPKSQLNNLHGWLNRLLEFL